jgi:hypothetical protein
LRGRWRCEVRAPNAALSLLSRQVCPEHSPLRYRSGCCSGQEFLRHEDRSGHTHVPSANLRDNRNPERFPTSARAKCCATAHRAFREIPAHCGKAALPMTIPGEQLTEWFVLGDSVCGLVGPGYAQNARSGMTMVLARRWRGREGSCVDTSPVNGEESWSSRAQGRPDESAPGPPPEIREGEFRPPLKGEVERRARTEWFVRGDSVCDMGTLVFGARPLCYEELAMSAQLPIERNCRKAI